MMRNKTYKQLLYRGGSHKWLKKSAPDFVIRRGMTSPLRYRKQPLAAFFTTQVRINTD